MEIENQYNCSEYLFEYILNLVHENYENIIKDPNIAKILNVDNNSICLKLKKINNQLSNRELQCISFTLLYILLLNTIFSC